MRQLKIILKLKRLFNKKDAIQFLKTHSFLFNFNKNYPFTNFDNTSRGNLYCKRSKKYCNIFYPNSKV